MGRGKRKCRRMTGKRGGGGMMKWGGEGGGGSKGEGGVGVERRVSE